MKILFIPESFTYFQKDLHDEFKKQGEETQVFLFKPPSSWNKIRNILNLLRVMRNCDAFFVEFLGSHCYSVCRLKKWHKKPIFVRCHRDELFENLNIKKLQFSVKNVCGIFCASNFIRKRLISICPVAEEKSLVLPNGVDVQRFYPINHQKNEVIRIGSVGFLIPRKGFAELIYAVNDLINDGYNVSLHIAGKGPIKEELTNLIAGLGKSDQIFLDGFIPDEKLTEWYNSNDIYVQNSKNEGQCLTILEAMSCGLPVVTSNIADVSEYVKKEYIYPVDDADGLKEKLKGLLGSSEKWKHIGEENRRKVLRDFNLTKQTIKMISVIKEMM